jgi:antitoxin YefM
MLKRERSARMPTISASGALSRTTIERLAVMSITASEARKGLLPLIKKVNEDHDAIEIVSRHGNAVLISAEDYAALRGGRLPTALARQRPPAAQAYEDALNGLRVAEHALIDPDPADAR